MIDPIIWVAIIGFGGTIIVSVTGVIVSLLNRKRVDQLHTLINSNLARQIEQAIAEALARGIVIGIEQERTRSEEKRPF
jgi:hypothetical protein